MKKMFILAVTLVYQGLFCLYVQSMNISSSGSPAAIGTTSAVVSTMGLMTTPSMTEAAMQSTAGVVMVSSSTSPRMTSSVQCTPATGDGPQVTLTINVMTTCNSTSHAKGSSMYTSLKASLEVNLWILCKQLSLKAVVVLNLTCNNTQRIVAIVYVTFGAEFPAGTYIEDVITEEVKGGKLGNLSVDRSIQVEFNNITTSFSPKDGECKSKCCEGGAGPIDLEETCAPVARCRGRRARTKSEDGHCPGNEGAKCPECDDSSSISIRPSLAMILLLSLSQFLKTMV